MSSEPSLPGVPSSCRLNEEQREIALICDRHLVIDAGAGSGKTTLLVEKMMHEMGFGAIPGESPPAVLRLDEVGAITFTRKAAGEIRERLRREFIRRAERTEGTERERWAVKAFGVDQAMIETIDAFAARIIRDYGALAGVEAGFEVLDGGDAQILYGEVAEAAILEAVEHADPGASFLVRHFGFVRARDVVERLIKEPALLLECARRARSGTLSWSSVLGELTSVDRILEPFAQQVFRFAEAAHTRLKERMEREGVLDFSHVLLRAAELAEVPEVQEAFQTRTRLLFIDEHQDTNLTQVRLLFQLAGVRSGQPQPPRTRLVLVGDPKQGIYGFRGADITMWKRSANRLRQAGGEYRFLRRNHRSRPTLLRFFDQCFGKVLGPAVDPKRPDYEVGYRGLDPVRPDTEDAGVEVLLAPEPGVACDAQMVADRIAEMLLHPEEFPVYRTGADGSQVRESLQRRDIAILSRQLKGVASHYEEALRQRGIESYVLSGSSLFRRDEVRDLTHLLRAVADPYDPFSLTAFLRSPLGGVDDVTLLELARVSTAAPKGEPGRSLYEALQHASQWVSDTARRSRAERAAHLLARLRGLRDRLPHHHLLEQAVEESGYRAFLAGAPDAPAGLRNLEKLLLIARRAAREPLSEFVRRLARRVRTADAEEEAPLYSPDDDLVTISTIHQAKGLEWPYVFVVGLDRPMLRRDRGDQPRLHPDLGLTMDLEIVLRDGSTEARLQESSQAWEYCRTDRLLREYAEAKRLFYVACTRAEDRLFLCGALNKPKGRGMFSDVKFMHDDAVERWLRHLFPALTRNGEAGASFEYGEGRPGAGGELLPERALVRRETLVAPEHPTSIGAKRREQWIPDAGLAVPHLTIGGVLEWPAAVQRGVASLERHAIIRDEFSASELLKFATCPWMHFFGYRGAIGTPSIEGDADQAIVNEILPRLRGDILHDYLRRHQDHWSEAEQLEQMALVLLRHLQMPDESARTNARALLVHAADYLTSPWYGRVQQALRVYREIPFNFQLPSGVRFRGVLDLLWQEADGWRILDFKTGVFRATGERLNAQIAARTEEYRIQAAIYTMGALATLGADQVKEFVFFYTSPGSAAALPVSAEWPKVQLPEIERIVHRVQAGEYGEAPVYEERVCRGCDYLRVCRPRNAPPLIPLGPLVQVVGAPSDIPIPA